MNTRLRPKRLYRWRPKSLLRSDHDPLSLLVQLLVLLIVTVGSISLLPGARWVPLAFAVAGVGYAAWTLSPLDEWVVRWLFIRDVRSYGAVQRVDWNEAVRLGWRSLTWEEHVEAVALGGTLKGLDAVRLHPDAEAVGNISGVYLHTLRGVPFEWAVKYERTQGEDTLGRMVSLSRLASVDPARG